MKLGLIQVDNSARDGYSERLEKLCDAAEEAFSLGADIVFFPEEYQYVPTTDILSVPMKLRVMTEEWKVRCASIAARNHGYLVPWDYEVAPDGAVYNTSYILDRSGDEIGRYRKVHIPYAEMIKGISRGRDFPVFDLDFGKVGIMICFDNYFPESARILGIRGAQLVLYPFFGDTLKPAWELKLRARAADNSLYIASCRTDTNSDTSFTGLIGPDGGTVERIRENCAVRVAEIDLSKTLYTHTTGSNEITEDIRAYLSRCRNTEAYGGILESGAKKTWNDIFCGKKPE